jgi:hypothetical protein
MSLSETMSAAGLAVYAEAALVLFFAAFVVVLIQVARKHSSESFSHESTLPFDDAEDAHGRSTARETPEAIHNGH